MRMHTLILMAMGLTAMAAAPKDEKESMAGTWRAESFTTDGVDAPQDFLDRTKLTIEGDRYILTVGEHVLKGTYKIDPEKMPKTIDIHYENLEIAQGRIIQGIYVLEGDTLKTCFAWSGFERPTRFESPVWGGRRLETWKRVKP